MDRLAQGVTNRAHRCTETEDQRIQDSHSQPHARFSTFFLRGTDEYRPVAAGTRRPQAAAAVSPRWRRPKQFSRPRGCICAARSFQLAVVVSFRFARHPPKDDYEAAEDSNVVRANGQIKKLLRRVRYHF